MTAPRERITAGASVGVVYEHEAGHYPEMLADMLDGMLKDNAMIMAGEPELVRAEDPDAPGLINYTLSVDAVRIRDLAAEN